MVRKGRARSSSLFLMELILAILFFSVASAVCVQFFVRSHLLSRDSNALNHAVSECSGIAEAVCTTDSAEEAAALLQTLYPDCEKVRTVDAGSTDDDFADLSQTDAMSAVGTYDIYYNEAFEACPRSEAAYLLSVQLTAKDQMLDAAMRMTAYTEAGADAVNSAAAGSDARPDSAAGSDVRTDTNGTDDTFNSVNDTVIYELTIRHHLARRTGN